MKKTIACGILFLGLVLLIPSVCWGANSKVGTTAYGFLKIDPSARSTGMGGAFVGLSDDESALYFNPAGLIQVETNRFFTTYNNYITDIQSGFWGMCILTAKIPGWVLPFAISIMVLSPKRIIKAPTWEPLEHPILL